MVQRSDVNYFGAGPAPLPTAVLEKASQALLNYQDKGLGLCEISHRSPEANAILAETKQALSDLLEIPDDYDILFLQSGGSGEFSATVYNLVSIWVEKKRAKIAEEVGDNKEEVLKRLRKVVDEELKVDYLVTGSWSLKASQEAARLIGAKHVNVAVDARKANDGKFGKIPSEDQWSLTPRSSGGPAFVYFCDNETVDGVEFPSSPSRLLGKEGNSTPSTVYFCDNETVDGVEFPSFPKSLEGEDAPIVVADMSSNFISRKVDVKKYGVIFGGAQKNIGNTGIAIAILKKSLLPPQSPYASPDLLRELNLAVGPIVLDYPTIAKNNSLYNTLPIFDVWVAGQVMKGLVDSYGAKRIGGQEEISDEKASLIYGVLDKYSSVYRVVPDKSVRSRMNICFRISGGDADKEKAFLAGAEKKGLLGLKGHRSVGGIRASNYNAVSLEGAKLLASYLEEYAKSA